MQTFQTNLALNMVEIGIFGGKIKISVFGKKGCIFRSLCFSEPVVFCFWTIFASELVELLNYFYFWTSWASELFCFWTIWASELFCFWSEFRSWTVLLLNYLSFWTSLLLKGVSLLNYFTSELFCSWTILLLNWVVIWICDLLVFELSSITCYMICNSLLIDYTRVV